MDSVMNKLDDLIEQATHCINLAVAIRDELQRANGKSVNLDRDYHYEEKHLFKE